MLVSTILSTIQTITARTDLDAIALVGINAQTKLLAARREWKQLKAYSSQTLVSGANTLAVTGSPLRVMAIQPSSDTEKRLIQLRTVSWLDREWPYRDYNQRPEFCAYLGGTLYFNSKATEDIALRLTTYALPATLTSVSTYPIDLLEPAMTAFGASLVFKTLELPESAKPWDELFNLYVSQAISADIRNHAESDYVGNSTDSSTGMVKSNG